MRTNPVKEKLARGEATFGTMVFEFASPGLPAVLANAGAEFVLYDMEHSGISEDEIKRQLSYCRGLGIVALVRPPEKSYAASARLLDLGALGLMACAGRCSAAPTTTTPAAMSPRRCAPRTRAPWSWL
jgi:2-keto-3-deoxy-L-rhamnonate aldolase RhmA